MTKNTTNDNVLNSKRYYPLLFLRSELGTFDVIVTSLTIHHLTHERKHSIYEEVFSLLSHGGVFCNLEHVDSPTASLHEHFLACIGDKVGGLLRRNILTD
jgi:SAM-dependent methyltransferase